MSDTNGSGKIDFAARRKQAQVYVPELDHTFTLRAISAGQRGLLKDDFYDPVMQLSVAIVGDDGQRLYTTAEDIANLAEISVTAMRPLLEALDTMHGVSPQAIETIRKNSEAAPNTDSASG